MTGPKECICCVQDLMKQIEASGLFEGTLTHLRIWFRGQREENWPLQPTVYRGNFKGMSPPKRLETERLLMQDFRVQSAALRNGRETDEELYFLQQHYRMPTRLLDWTTSPLAALFFAVEGVNQSDVNGETDGELFMVDAPSLSYQGTKFGKHLMQNSAASVLPVIPYSKNL